MRCVAPTIHFHGAVLPVSTSFSLTAVCDFLQYIVLCAFYVYVAARCFPSVLRVLSNAATASGNIREVSRLIEAFYSAVQSAILLCGCLCSKHTHRCIGILACYCYFLSGQAPSCIVLQALLLSFLFLFYKRIEYASNRNLA